MSTSIKQEDASAASSSSSAAVSATIPLIKSENVKMEGMSPMSEDDDQYEDAGDLDITKGDTIVWLVKLPDFVVENWEKIDDDEEIHLANVRVYNEDPTKNINQQGDKVKFFLTSNHYNEGIPKMYDMVVTDRDVKSTYVFTEKDMPGFKNKLQVKGGLEGAPSIPARLLYPDRGNDRKFSKSKPFQPFVRKAIPKRTSLVGTVKHEAAVTPYDNMEYRNYLKRKRTTMEDEQRRKKIQVLDGTPSSNLLAPGTYGAGTASFESFIKPVGQQKKPQEAKASRMPKNELLDALFECFSQYEYWSLKGLRDQLNQPESYLKETLESIGVLLKNGPFALKWTLKPEYKNRPPEDVKNEVKGDDDDNEEDDNEDEFEDVA